MRSTPNLYKREKHYLKAEEEIGAHKKKANINMHYRVIIVNNYISQFISKVFFKIVESRVCICMHFLHLS